MTIDGRRKGKKALEEERKGFSERHGDLGRVWGVIGGASNSPGLLIGAIYKQRLQVLTPPVSSTVGGGAPSQQSDRKRAENTQSPGALGTLRTGGHPGLVIAIKQETCLIGNRPSHLQDRPLMSQSPH